jgi:hypothetical protein
LKGIQLSSEIGGERTQEVLRLVVRVEIGVLRALAGLLAGYVVTVLVVDVNAVKMLVRDDAGEIGGELVFFPEAVIPAVIAVARPRTPHTGPAKG